ncbi:MucR family transcriptional regulator [Asticcacaulis excentricus]|uniref:Transcriptional regulator, MucR family n=1 Tax=Asticcacaulis excentricus (strain ATCC 15261 / DSM 4724 / KCTC 12464 / NCIMB 9791 / VKM B-1370 / CB 48) TaxID=573065 RepID=E8RUR1_ASTEC|nr:MucR family transcriptional regulator [Asticcacaulis excentricus]ADU14111.1 transcriptional regulator, MucR family [Asticcacaulis excentricus CB 48]
MEQKTDTTNLVVEIVTAYVSNNSVPAAELPQLIQSVSGALNSLASGPVVEPENKTPAVSIKKSVGTDYIICLEDGRRFKSLKRHLASKYNLTPDEYRARWNLPKDYPMVAPAYAEARSNLAKQMGLGQGGRKSTSQAAPKPGRRAKA